MCGVCMRVCAGIMGLLARMCMDVNHGMNGVRCMEARSGMRLNFLK